MENEEVVAENAARDAADDKAESEAIASAKAAATKELGKLESGKVKAEVDVDGELKRTAVEPEEPEVVEEETETEVELPEGEHAEGEEKEGEHAETETKAVEPSRQLVREAAKLGIPDEDIDSFDAKELAAAVKVAKRMGAKPSENGQPQPQKPDFSPLKVSKEEREIIGDQAANILDARAEADAKRQEQIWNASQKNFEQRAAVVEQRETVRVLDDFFSKRPDVFGEGEAVDLDPNSKEQRARMKVVRELQNVSPNLPAKKALEAATALAFPELAKETARKEIKAAIAKRRASAINAPTHREPPPPAQLSPEDEALEAARARYKELAVS